MSSKPADIAEPANFRTNLRGLLEAADAPSCRVVAETAGIHWVTLSRILCGHIVPTMDTAARLARAVGHTLPNLLAAPQEFSEKILESPVDSR